MSIVVLVEFNSKPEATNTLKQFMADALPDTRAYDGCISLDVYNNADSDNNIVMGAKWESREHQEKAMELSAKKGTFEKLGEMLSSKPSFRYFDKLDI